MIGAVESNKSYKDKQDTANNRFRHGLVQCYDDILQNSFALGLTLQKIKETASTDSHMKSQLDAVIKELDEAINRLRRSICLINTL